MSEQRYDEAYFEAYQHDPLREAWYRSERDAVEARYPRGGSILDVGCGLGTFLQLFDDSRWRKFGVDVSEHAIAAARARGIAVKAYDRAYDYPDESFDVIVFRGTVQHLDTPFAVIQRCVRLLKTDGLMAFLSTPNANALCFRWFGTLPFLEPELNYWIPSDTTLPNALGNFGLTVLEVRHPYLETPYARPLRDHLRFALRCLGIKTEFPFWGNMMECYATKRG